MSQTEEVQKWPRISVITPSYNQGRYLEACIESVHGQGYPNLEYIIMDGGSQDGSVEIIRKYEKHLTYWQSQPDEGQYHAINEGFRRSTGEIMTWLNSDDMFHPDAFRKVAEIFQQRPEVEWVMGRPNGFNEQGEQAWIFDYLPRWSREKYLNREYKNPYIQQEGTFWRRSLWVQAGATLDTQWDLAGDLELWARFFRHALLYTLDAMLAGYRSQPRQKAQLFLAEYHEEAERIIDREVALYQGGSFPGLLPAPEPIIPAVSPAILPNKRGFNILLADPVDVRLRQILRDYLDAFTEEDDVALHVLGLSQLEAVQAAILETLDERGLDPDHVPDVSLLDLDWRPEHCDEVELLVGAPEFVIDAREQGLPAFMETTAERLRLARAEFKEVDWALCPLTLDTTAAERWLLTEPAHWETALRIFLERAGDSSDVALLIRVRPGTSSDLQDAIAEWLIRHGHDLDAIPDVLLIDEPKAMGAALFRHATAWIDTGEARGRAMAQALGVRAIPLHAPAIITERHPLVSVLVSTYNAEGFIRGCLANLEAESLAADMEILVIDSGSEQNEGEIVREFQRRYDNIHYLRTERESVYQAWNRGIRMARGTYITNANTDDRRRRECTETLVRALEAQPDKVLAYGDSIVTCTPNQTFETCSHDDYLNWPDFDRLTLLQYCYCGPHPVWKRSLHADLGYFDETYRCAADYEFWLRAAQKYEFIHVPRLLGAYWLDDSTVSRRGDLPIIEANAIKRAYQIKYLAAGLV